MSTEIQQGLERIKPFLLALAEGARFQELVDDTHSKDMCATKWVDCSPARVLAICERFIRCQDHELSRCLRLRPEICRHVVYSIEGTFFVRNALAGTPESLEHIELSTYPDGSIFGVKWIDATGTIKFSSFDD